VATAEHLLMKVGVPEIDQDRPGLRHVAIIMDGNGRWAQARGLPRLIGHRAGTENIRRIVKTCIDLRIDILTLYAFSTENWGRPQDEVSGLMQIFYRVSGPEIRKLHEANVRIHHLGRMEQVPAMMQDRIHEAVELTRHNTRMTLNLAFNYGGRAEIVDAVRAIMRKGMSPEQITEDVLAAHMYTAGQPDPDLMIRTAGEMRLSNFLLWQAAYAEYYASPKFWPDFDVADLVEAVEVYTARHRKFGRV